MYIFQYMYYPDYTELLCASAQILLSLCPHNQTIQNTKEANWLTAEDTESTKTEITTPRIVARVATSLGFIAEDYPRVLRSEDTILCVVQIIA